MSKSVICFIVLICLSNFSWPGDRHDQSFSEACHILADALNKNMSKLEMSQYIDSEMESRKLSEEVVTTFSALYSAAPADRLTILMSAAKHYTGAGWDCEAAVKLYGVDGNNTNDNANNDKTNNGNKISDKNNANNQ